MEKRNIIVVGASAGGFQAIKTLIAGLPKDLEAVILVVWHMSPDMHGILPEVLNRLNTLPATQAIDHEPMRMGHVYVAPPDQHLLIEGDHLRITRGPRENRFRPAVDPLFRSAAYAYGPRVIGIVLSGALDDGSAGMWTIKKRGGLAIVQSPDDAEMPSMPQNAMKAVKVDYQAAMVHMPSLLVKLVTETVSMEHPPNGTENEKNKREVNLSLGKDAFENNLSAYSSFSPFTCPECHGVLSSLTEGDLMRFRCHTGHAFSTDSLLAALTEKIEDNLWNAIRSIQESIMLLNHLGDHCAEANQPKLAAIYFQKAREADKKVILLRQLAQQHEQLSTDSIDKVAAGHTVWQPSVD
jgi:two-component system chemotaxis response regulator CheB